MKRNLFMACLVVFFSLFLLAYSVVWFSGDYDESQYIDTYRVFVTCGLALSFCALKMEVKNEEGY